MRKALILIAILAATTTKIPAQTYLQHLQATQQGQGKVTVTESEDIDILVNTVDVSGNRTITQSQNSKATAVATPNKNDEQAKATTTPSNTENDNSTTDKAERRTYKTNGYRIQVFAGGNSREDKAKAQKIGSNLKRDMPDQSVYVHFNSPRWLCRMGNFKTQEEANAVLQEVIELGYKDVCIVSDKIIVSY